MDLRQACDRCHGKKLRCIKQPGSIICSRCAKANVPCLFSPPTRPLRSSTAQPQHQPDALGFDWPSLLAFDNVTSESLGNEANQPLETTPPVSGNVNGQEEATEISLLADLATSLDRLHQGFPTSTVHKHVSVDEMKRISQSEEGKFDLQRTLELLLQNGQELSELYPKILNKANQNINRPIGDDSCTIPDCMHHLKNALRPRKPPLFDHSLINLLIACHLRLLDILDNIMDHARVCSHLFSTLPKDHKPNFDIPEIRIGSFVAPKDSAASLVTTMLVELQSLLNTRCQELPDLVVSKGETSIETRLLTMQCENLGQRAVATLDDMRQLRMELFSSGIIR